MSEDQPATPGVSKARKVMSTLLLLVLTAVLAIELRASVGHAWTGSLLSEKSENGIFTDTKFDDVKAMLKFWPSEEVVGEAEDETEYRYSWYSLLRPLLNKPKAEYFLVKKTNGDNEGVIYDVQPPNSGDKDKLFRALGGDFGGAGPGGMGVMTRGGVETDYTPPPRRGTDSTPRARPIMEDEADEPKTDEPKTDEPKTDESKTDEPKTDEPKTDEPKTDEPKTDEPKTDEPKTNEPKTDKPKSDE